MVMFIILKYLRIVTDHSLVVSFQLFAALSNVAVRKKVYGLVQDVHVTKPMAIDLMLP